MKEMRISRLWSCALWLVLALAILPVVGIAAEEAFVSEQIKTSAGEISAAYSLSGEASSDPEELFEQFVVREMYGSKPAANGVVARNDLNGAEKILYDILKPKIEYVARNGGSTVFTFESIPGMKTSWTNKELGVESIGFTNLENAFEGQFSFDAVVEALLLDCPFDFYWYDKTVYASWRYNYMMEREPTYPSTYGRVYDLKVTFQVSTDFDGGNNTTVSSDVSRIATARNTAAQVVENNKGKTDYEKMVAYAQYICDAVSYDHSAANSVYYYGDPWQLISAFDGDSTTNIVCEGYSKAFQYLCDLSGLQAICVTGDAGGPHMWNVATLGGKNYLVDVTNSDSGTIGENGGLFLVGGTYVNGTYTFWIDSQNSITYECKDLKLAPEDYVPAYPTSGTCGKTLFWEFDRSSGKLNIFGTGAMADYAGKNAPWYGHEKNIKTILLEKGVTSIGHSAFAGCENLMLVSYTGTANELKSLTINANNAPFNNALVFVNASADIRNGWYKLGDQMYYFQNSVLLTNRMIKDSSSVWYYVGEDGTRVTGPTLVPHEGKWWYVNNGAVDFNCNTLVKYNNQWYHVNRGERTKATTLVKYSDQWWYVKDGIVDFTANTLVKYGTTWYHVKGGKWVKDNALVGLGGTTYYVKNGVVDFTVSGFTYCNGNWYNLSGGKVVKSTTLVNYGGKWWFVSGGVWTKATTLVNYGGTWYYVKDGIVDFGANTLVKYGSTWYYVKGGKWVKDNAMVSYSGTLFYVKNGTVDFTAKGFTYCAGGWYNLSGGKAVKSTTLINYGGKWWYVKDGVWTKSTTLVNYGGTWYYVKDGIVDFAANTLLKYGNSWYHVKGGKWVKDTALVGLGGTTYYVKNGTVDFTANGFTYCNGNWYNLSGGKLLKTTTLVNYGGKWWFVSGGIWTKATTLVNYGGTWYYVKDGIVDFGANTLVKYGTTWYHVSGGKWVKDNTLVKYGATWYYVKNGVVDFTYSGSFLYGGKYYTVKKGVVVF